MQATCSSATSRTDRATAASNLATATNRSRAARTPSVGHVARILGALIVALTLFVPATAEAGRVRYTVAPGDSLLGIAIEYDVSVDQLRRWNRLEGDDIFIGQELIIHTRSAAGERRQISYTVRSGDTGLAIARRHGVSGADLERWNPRVNMDRLRPGQELTMYIQDVSSGSAGDPNSGRLRGGVQLETGTGFRVRDPSRAFGALSTIDAIRVGASRVVARYIDAPDVVVHDLSFERGGRMPPHRSHQNGLDADISYYRIGAVGESPYEAVTPEELDVRLQWYLFRTWIDQGVVEYIFVNHELQEPLYEYARARGATEAQLEEWFQYPSRSRRGVIRHEPGHDDHFHIRFHAVDE